MPILLLQMFITSRWSILFSLAIASQPVGVIWFELTSTFFRLWNISEVKINRAPWSPRLDRGSFKVTMFLVKFEFCISYRFYIVN